MNLHEWPLIIFTVLIQTAVGAFIWCFLAMTIFSGENGERSKERLNRTMIIIWLLMIIALALSMFHLGSPLRAIHSIYRLGAAPLSNEIFCTGAFIGLGIISWFIGVKFPNRTKIRNILMLITAMVGIILIFVMARVYHNVTVPMWDSATTESSFWATTFIAGSACGAFLFSLAKITHNSILRAGPIIFAGISIVIAIIVMIMQLVDLAAIQNAPLRDMSALFKSCAFFFTIRFLLLFGAIFIWGWCIVRKTHPNIGVMSIVVLLAILAEMAGRLVFYSLNMTVGLI